MLTLENVEKAFLLRKSAMTESEFEQYNTDFWSYFNLAYMGG